MDYAPEGLNIVLIMKWKLYCLRRERRGGREGSPANSYCQRFSDNWMFDNFRTESTLLEIGENFPLQWPLLHSVAPVVIGQNMYLNSLLFYWLRTAKAGLHKVVYCTQHVLGIFKIMYGGAIIYPMMQFASEIIEQTLKNKTMESTQTI